MESMVPDHTWSYRQHDVLGLCDRLRRLPTLLQADLASTRLPDFLDRVDPNFLMFRHRNGIGSALGRGFPTAYVRYWSYHIRFRYIHDEPGDNVLADLAGTSILQWNWRWADVHAGHCKCRHLFQKEAITCRGLERMRVQHRRHSIPGRHPVPDTADRLPMGSQDVRFYCYVSGRDWIRLPEAAETAEIARAYRRLESL